MSINLMRYDQNKAGFTLLEMIIVLAILVALASSVGLIMANILFSSKSNTALIEMSNMKHALLQYYKDNGCFPPSTWGKDPNNIDISGLVVLIYDFSPQNNKTTTRIYVNGVEFDYPHVFTSANDINKDGIHQQNEPCRLIDNECSSPPRFNQSTGIGWNGPYIDPPDVDALIDPWNEPYLYKNILNDSPENSGKTTDLRIVILISGGPNKLIDTTSDHIKFDSIEKQKDDIVILVHGGNQYIIK
ncbi:MAG: prepilin-type N-terminal cleavage/methylation domain-containing protein [Desulfobacterales bacterium]|nr:prepilin-type N-terminal cleavage/methylation domain-containing protein [Desulfobacterales bacterium]